MCPPPPPPPPPPFLRTLAPAPYFHSLFKFFRFPAGGNQNLLPSSFKKRGRGEGGGPSYGIICIIFLSAFGDGTRMSMSTVSLLALLNSGILYL